MMKLSIHLFIISICLLTSDLSKAHDPGLSFAEIKIQADHMTANVEFARRDIESLIAIDSDQDNTVSEQEFIAAKPALEKLAFRALSISYQGNTDDQKNTAQQLKPIQLLSIVINESDTLQITLRYPVTSLKKLLISAPLIPELPRGHRQYLLVNDHDDLPIDNAVLSASSMHRMISIQQFSEEDSVFYQRSHIILLSEFIQQGIYHIWTGFDHILFIVTLLLPVVLIYNERAGQKPGWIPVDNIRTALMGTLRIVTVFTLAHSITLSLATLDIIQLPSMLVEPVIALSVILVACNNLWPFFSHSRGLFVFAFGLIHGFGFAGVLAELNLPEGKLLPSLLGFNLGVEIGQVVIVILLLPVLYWARRMAGYQRVILKGGSAAAVLVAGVWLFERVAYIPV